jgi:hypothetical protein
MTMSSSVSLQLAVFPPKGYTLSNPFSRLLKYPDKVIPMDPDLNQEQREAVETVSALYLRGQEDCKEASFVPAPPFIIFGPPGTGEWQSVLFCSGVVPFLTVYVCVCLSVCVVDRQD